MDNRHGNSNKSAPHQLPLGTILKEHYRIDGVLGQGGFGITYLGWDLNLDTQVAIKEYFPRGYVNRDCSYSNEVTSIDDSHNHLFTNNRERFLREAQALAKFSDIPEIVCVLNFFEENGTAYIVEEFVDGVDLRKYAKAQGGTLSVKEVLTILKPIMQALDKVHRAGLVHRDISPDNIMMVSPSEAILLDFGAIRDVADADPEKVLTKSTENILKLGFAPIEQYQSRGALGPWTDVYALCASIYYCITGSIPPEVSTRINDDIHPNWREISELTENQIFALENGMQIRAKDRTASVEELYAQLFGEDLYGKKVVVKKQKTKKKNTRIIATLASMLCVVTGIIGIAFFLHFGEKKSDSPEIEPQSVQMQAVTELSETTQPQTEPTALTLPATIPTEPKATVEETTIPTEEVFFEESGSTWLYPEDAWKTNVMRKYSIPASIKDPSTHSVFGSKIQRWQIKSVTFQDHIADATDDAWDVSQSHNRSVLAWGVQRENSEYYDLYIGGIGGINGASACPNLFAYFINVETITFGNVFHTDRVPITSGMFYECNSLKSLDLSNFDTSQTTDMSSMFYGCRSLEKLDVSGFVTSKAHKMEKMFYNCSSLKKLDVSNFDTRTALSLEGFFYGCSSVEELDVSGFNTSHVNNMNDMFAYCSGLKTLDVSNLNTSKVYYMNGMFRGCSGLENLNVSNFKTLSVMEMSYLFEGCSGLKRLDLSNFETSYANSLEGMFSGCSSLTNLNIRSISTKSARSLRDMFNKCSSLTTLNVSHFDTVRVTDMGYMFSECSSLTELYVGNFDTKSVTNMENMFYMCGSLNSLDVSNFVTHSCKDMSQMFYGCTNLILFDFDNFKVGQVKDFENFMMDKCIVNGQYWQKLFRPYG